MRTRLALVSPFVLVASLLLGALPAYAGLIPIDIVSESYRVWGLSGWPPSCSWESPCPFDVSDTQSVYSPYGDGTHAIRTSEASQLVLETHVGSARDLYSRLEFEFRPTVSGSGNVGFYGFTNGVAWWAITLDDVTAGIRLLDLGSGSNYCSPEYMFPTCFGEVTLTFSETHQYHVSLSATGSDDHAEATIRMPFTVPDLPSSSLLLGIGLAGLGVWRKRWQ